MKEFASRVLLACALSATLALVVTWSASARTGTVTSSGTTVGTSSVGTDGLQSPELRPGLEAEDGGPIVDRPRPGFKNGKFPKRPLDAPTVASSLLAITNPELGLSFNGLNHRDQRLANGGNQFSLEPPDQGLCVGHGRVVEPINAAVRIYDTAGNPLTGVVDLNTFFGLPAAINRTTGVFGPFVFDPVCLYDGDIDRFIIVAAVLEVVPATGDFTGRGDLYIAVSPTGDPSSLGGWTIYTINTTDDGTGGTPDHGCESDADVAHPNAAFGDFPHIGADATGVYLTTNEYCFFGSGYNGAQIYAISKQQLATGPSITFVHIENTKVDGSPGFTVWPAISQPGQYSTERNGTEYFLSSIAGDGSETGNPTGTARRIGLWALTNTASLNTASPNPQLSSRLINSETYVFPPASDQKPGDFPLGQCINDTTLPTPFGPGCWQFLFFEEPAHNEVEGPLDSSDTRMMQTYYTGGRLYGALGTGVNVGGEFRSGIAWFVVAPKVNGAGKAEGQVKNQGYIALADNNLIYPALAVRPNGTGAIAFTIAGESFYPSAGYATFDAAQGTGAVHSAATGLGPQDGFTEYRAFGPPFRPRWGDYGAAVAVGSNIWIASEYIGQTCTLAQYVSGAFGSCGGTRTALANWYTRISRLTP